MRVHVYVILELNPSILIPIVYIGVVRIVYRRYNFVAAELTKIGYLCLYSIKDNLSNTDLPLSLIHI